MSESTKQYTSGSTGNSTTSNSSSSSIAYSMGVSSNSSSSTFYPTGQSKANLNTWATTINPTEQFYATGTKTERGYLQSLDYVEAWDKKFRQAGD
ncbi:hypothetical protein BGZ63DRAFT_392792, partial [Mariannaea sp. PMI_226]